MRPDEIRVRYESKISPIHRYTFSACKIVCGIRKTDPIKGSVFFEEIAMGNRDKRGKEPKKPKQPPKPPPLIFKLV